MSRPSKYVTHVKPYFDEIKKAVNRGVEETKIAEKLGISASTWFKFKNEYSEFSDILKKDDDAIRKILDRLDSALLKCAEGFMYEEEKRVGKKDKDGENIILVEKYKRYQPPNPTAIFGAYNRYDPNYKRDAAYYELKKQELELKKALAEANNFDLEINNE